MTGSREARHAPLRAGAAITGAALFLCAAAVYNRYPLLFFDAEMYVHPVIKFVRPPFYGFLLVPMHLTWSLWLVVFWQSMIVSHLVYRTLRTTFPGLGGRHHLAIILALVLLSSVSWQTCFVMPDMFASVLILATYLLVFRWSELPVAERLYLQVLFVASITVHSSHVPLVLGLLVSMWLLKILLRRAGVAVAVRTVPIAAGLAVAVGIVLTFNALTYRRLTLSPAGYAHVLARLLEDGPAVEYLRNCRPPDRYALCHHADEFPMKTNVFLWKPWSPLRKVGGLEGYADEGMAIVVGTVKTYPVWTLKTMIVNAVRQLTWLDSTLTYVPLTKFEALSDRMKKNYPREYPTHLQSRQSRGALGLETFDWIRTAGLVFSVPLALVVFYRWLRQRRWLPVMLFLTIVVGGLTSTSITGALSEPMTRYLMRVEWLIPLVACLGVASAIRARAQSRPGK